MRDGHRSSAHADLLQNFFAAIDRMDADAFAAHFDQSTGSFRFANHPPLIGRDAILQGCGGIFSLLTRIQHELIAHWLADDDLLVEGVVHYQRADGFELSVPFMSIFEFAVESPGLIHSYRVFVDSHELFKID